jgi:hypothetical protein
MAQVTLTTILDLLKANQYDLQVESETNQLFGRFKDQKREFPYFFRIFDQNLLQLIVFIPSQLRPKQPVEDQATKGDLARLLHLLNKELDLPGFGMDEEAGVIFYRLMIPTFEKQLNAELLINFLKASENICKLFADPILAISSGQMPLDDLLAKMQSKS